MSGVYGDFLETFPELSERVEIWTLDDKSDLRVITAAFIPTDGSKMKRRKYTSGNTGLDIVGEDNLYVLSCFSKSLAIGDYLTFNSKAGIHRVVDIVDYTKSAGYFVCKIQLVSGTTIEKTEKLVVKEGVF